MSLGWEGDEGGGGGDGLDEESVAYSGLQEECLCFDISPDNVEYVREKRTIP